MSADPSRDNESMEPDLVVVGVNHTRAPVEVRERLAIPRTQIPAVLATLKQDYRLGSAAVLSTCNRVEFYLISASAEPLVRFLIDRRFLSEDEAARLLYTHRCLDAVRHLFSVASGIDSMVLGEHEILGQVKTAYQIAAEAGAADPRLHIVFQEAFRAAGIVRSRTRVAEGHVSVSSVAVDLAQKVFGELGGRSVLVIGTGEMAEGALKALLARGVAAPYVASRTHERAAAIAERFGGRPVTMTDMPGVLPKADLILVSTSAPQYLLGVEDLRAALRARKNEPIFIIDISVPRNVDPAVNTLDNVYLSNIDELQQIAAQNLAERERELTDCRRIITEAAERCHERLHAVEVGEIAAGLRSSFETVRQEELAELFRKLDTLSEDERREVARMAERFQNRLLHGPLSVLREEAARDGGSHVVRAIRRLFGLGS